MCPYGLVGVDVGEAADGEIDEGAVVRLHVAVIGVVAGQPGIQVLDQIQLVAGFVAEAVHEGGDGQGAVSRN